MGHKGDRSTSAKKKKKTFNIFRNSKDPVTKRGKLMRRKREEGGERERKEEHNIWRRWHRIIVSMKRQRKRKRSVKHIKQRKRNEQNRGTRKDNICSGSRRNYWNLPRGGGGAAEVISTSIKSIVKGKGRGEHKLENNEEKGGGKESEVIKLW